MTDTIYYQHKKTNEVAEFIERNDKARTVTLKKSDGKFTAVSLSTFSRWWRKVEDATDAVVDSLSTDSDGDTPVVDAISADNNEDDVDAASNEVEDATDNEVDAPVNSDPDSADKPEKQKKASKKKSTPPKSKKATGSDKPESEDADGPTTVDRVAGVLDALGVTHKDVTSGLSISNTDGKRLFEVWKRKYRIRVNLNPDLIDFDAFDQTLAESVGPSSNKGSKLSITMYVPGENIERAIGDLVKLAGENVQKEDK